MCLIRAIRGKTRLKGRDGVADQKLVAPCPGRTARRARAPATGSRRACRPANDRELAGKDAGVNVFRTQVVEGRGTGAPETGPEVHHHRAVSARAGLDRHVHGSP